MEAPEPDQGSEPAREWGLESSSRPRKGSREDAPPGKTKPCSERSLKGDCDRGEPPKRGRHTTGKRRRSLRSSGRRQSLVPMKAESVAAISVYGSKELALEFEQLAETLKDTKTSLWSDRVDALKRLRGRKKAHPAFVF